MSEKVCDLMKQAEVHTERRTAGVYPIRTGWPAHGYGRISIDEQNVEIQRAALIDL